jgi:CBS domain-containing protein/anti-sigma regulatory factor (Ser/Thr protein kinase)
MDTADKPPVESAPVRADLALQVGAEPGAETSPLVLLEMIHRLKVRDVMCRDLLTLARSDSLKRAQELMRANNISGIPIHEAGRLYGLVSIDDIIRALEGGYILESCGRHMTTHLIVLEDDMPVSFALRYFGRYKYGRFPVLNRGRNLVGIVSQRDINRVLLRELTREVERLESAHKGVSVGTDEGDRLYMLCEYPVMKLDFENAGKAANEIKLLLRDRQVDRRIARRIAVAAYELELNICVHSEGGTLTFVVANGRAEITARDTGPGMADVEWACRDGTSTANDWIRSLGFGAGMGLPNTKRVSDTFEIRSQPGKGTTVRVGVDLHLGQPSGVAGEVGT